MPDQESRETGPRRLTEADMREARAFARQWEMDTRRRELRAFMTGAGIVAIVWAAGVVFGW